MTIVLLARGFDTPALRQYISSDLEHSWLWNKYIIIFWFILVIFCHISFCYCQRFVQKQNQQSFTLYCVVNRSFSTKTKCVLKWFTISLVTMHCSVICALSPINVYTNDFQIPFIWIVISCIFIQNFEYFLYGHPVHNKSK